MKTWLFHPFERIAGLPALLAGSVILLITSIVAFFGGIHLDGVLDLHIGSEASYLNCIIEVAVDWLSMSFFIYLAGLLFSKSSIRPVDVLGTQAMARFPVFISCIGSILCFRHNFLLYMQYTFLHIGEPVDISAAEVILFGIMLLITLVMTVWQVMLMYQAYAVACNVKGTKAVLSFTGSLLLAEISSKIILSVI